MGCVYSHSRRARHSLSQEENPRVFHVCNVDDRGTEVNFGKIEITDSELALHQKGRQSIFWSLRSLRRYGFDAELFSFECGRRCPTGPGIYAFKCCRAEQLFNTLQEAIQQCSQFPAPLQPPDSGQTPPEVGPRYPQKRHVLHGPEVHAHEYANSPFYVNCNTNTRLPTARDQENTNYAKLDDLVRAYVNINTNESGAHSPPDPVNYILLDLDGQPSNGGPTIVTTAPATPVSKTPTMDFGGPSPPPTPTASSPPPPPMPYAQIDFAKTVALSTSAANHRKV